MLHYFATTPKGLEPILASELAELGAEEITPDRGGVHFAGSLAVGLRANLWLRTAMRVLTPITGPLPAATAQDLYDAASGVRWDTWITPRHTISIEAHGKTSGLIHTHFTGQRIKDAIADQLRARTGARPSVDGQNPDVLVVAHLHKERATLYLDLSGGSLHRRGYRAVQTEAPLKEPIAAALLLWSGWDGTTPLADPMCGSATFSIEAALIALRRGPNAERPLGIERWPSFSAADAKLLRGLRQEARGGAARPLPIYASDLSSRALQAAQANLHAAGLNRVVQLSQQDARQLAPLTPPGLVVMNPPYGERLGAKDEALAGLYRALGQQLKTLAGHKVTLLASDKALARSLGMMPQKTLPLFNGPIECAAYHYEIWDVPRR